MHEDRVFDPEPSVRRLARTIYERTAALPIVSPHGHVDPRLLADDAPFPEPTTLFILPDHYVLRMLYSQGLSLESLGVEPNGAVPDREAGLTPSAAPVRRDPRRIWQLFADHYFLFRGTPTAAWLDYQFDEIFGIRQALESGSALRIYDEIAEKLADAGVPPARAVRPIQDRGSGDDRRGQRPARSPRPDSRLRMERARHPYIPPGRRAPGRGPSVGGGDRAARARRWSTARPP